MRFYCKKDTDSFEAFKDKVEIIEQLLYPPVSIPLIESNYQNNGIGKKAAREIVQSTTDSLVILIVFSTVIFVLSSELNIHPAWSVVPFFSYIIFTSILKLILGHRVLRELLFTFWFLLTFIIATGFSIGIFFVMRNQNFSILISILSAIVPILIMIGFVVFFILKRRDSFIDAFYSKRKIDFAKIKSDFISQNPGDDNMEKKEQIEKFFRYSNRKSDKEESIRYFAIYLSSQEKRFFVIDKVITTVPFSLRNIWLWSLIIGVCTLYVKKEYQMLLGGSIDNKLFQDFTSDFFRVLLIAVVSYIATNVISELLQLREQYVQGRDEMKSLNEIIKNSKRDFSQVATNAEYLVGTSSIRSALKKLRDKVSENINEKHPLDSVFKSFTETISEQFLVITNQVKENDLINLWIISSLNQYFKVSSEELNQNSSIITKFQFFGKILKETFQPILQNESFLKKFKEDYEVYTVIVLPPKRFLNYDENGTKRNEDWNQFIVSCILSKNKELKINRHFLAIDPNVSDDDFLKKELGEECIDLKKEFFQEQLKDEYYYSTNASHNDDEIIFGTKESFPKFNSTDAKLGYTNKALSDVLDNLHFNNSCKVIELKIPTGASSDTTKLNIFADILWDSKTDKTLDYFAIRETKSKEWLFCFKTVMDKSFDFAHIEIHHKKEDIDKWSNICKNLDKVFLTAKTPNEDGILKDENLGISIYPINNYK